MITKRLYSNETINLNRKTMKRLNIKNIFKNQKINLNKSIVTKNNSDEKNKDPHGN